MQRLPRLDCLRLIAAALLTAASAGEVAAQGNIMPMIGPIPGYSPMSGLQLQIDFPMTADAGYIPVEFTFRRLTASLAAQEITIQFHSSSSRRRQHAIAVEQTFDLPAGQLVGQCSVAVPYYYNWSRCRWEVWVDGRKDDSLSPRSINAPQGHADATSVLVTPSQRVSRNAVVPSLDEALGGGVRWVARPLKQRPAEWIDHSALDLAIVSVGELQTLRDEHAEQFTAMLRWVRAGGNLWIEETGSRWEQLPEVEKTLGLNTAGERQTEGSPRPGWYAVSLDERAKLPVESYLEIAGVDTAMAASSVITALDGEKESTVAPDTERPPGQVPLLGTDRWVDPSPNNSKSEPGTTEDLFLVRSFGLGTVTVQRSQRPLRFRQGGALAHALTNSLIIRRLSWSARHGVSTEMPNYDFNNWLIPGVGVAPVGAFQLLISLFVVAIGPLNYWLLSRANKLPLLLVTVPAAAAGITLLLFAYGFLMDGFGTKVRARSLTTLDQQAGEAATWTRLSYYAGMAPEEGLAFDDQTVVYPIRSASSGYETTTRNDRRLLVWDADRQRLTRGWLASRTPAQYLTITSRATARHIDIAPRGDAVEVTNRLGVGIVVLAIEDHQGKFYWAEDVADGATVRAQATAYIDVAGQLRELFTDNEPSFPIGGEIDSRMTSARLDQNLMEGQLGATVSPVSRSLGPGRYVAVTDRGIDLDLGVEGAAEKASFHVVQGSFAPPARSAKP